MWAQIIQLQKTSWLTVLTLVLGLVSTAVPAADKPSNIDDVQARLDSTSLQLEELHKDIDQAQSLRDDLKTALQQAESGLGERESRLQELQQQIAQFDQQLIAISTKISRVEAAVSTTRGALSTNLRAASATGSQSPLKILLQHKNTADAQRMQVYSTYVFKAQRELMLSQLAIVQDLKTAQDKLRKDRNWLNHIRKKAEQQREGYVLSARQNRLQLTEIEQSVTQKTQTISQLKSDQQRLQSLMDELQSTPDNQSGYFAGQKGHFSMPVASGNIVARFGDLKSVGKLRWNGLFIQSPVNTAVSAMADGEVLYSDWLQGFGMLVILEHGDGYMSLYGGNRTVLVQPGEWVESGSTIATVGDSGGQKTSGVYFEIRHNATALDPEKWVRVDQS